MDGERVGVSGAGIAAACEVSRAARWQWLSGSEVRPSGAGVAVAGVLTFAAVSEVGVSGRRVDGGHSLN